MYDSVYYDRRHSRIHWGEYDAQNNRSEKWKKWVPDFYIELNVPKPTEDLENEDEVFESPSEFLTQSGKPLKKIITKTFNKRYKTIKYFKNAGLNVYGSDLSPENKFILETWPEDIVNAPKVRYAFIDIETECENGFPQKELAEEKINLITLYTNFDQTYHTFGLNHEYTPKKNNVVYTNCCDEEELLEKFLKFLERHRVCVWSGWNSADFDVPYIFNRILRIMDDVDVMHYNKILKLSKGDDGASYKEELEAIEEKFDNIKRLSPYKHVQKRAKLKKDRFDKQMKLQMVYDIAGVTDYDYLLLDQQFRQGKRTSYKLDNVADEELGERKLEYDGSMKDFYKNNWERFVDYNIQDVAILTKLEDKLGYLGQAIILSYKCHCIFKDNFGTVQKAEAAIYNFLQKDGIIMNDKKEEKKEDDNEDDEDEKLPGGYVTPKEELKRGKHYWVVDADVSSLYPSLMRGINISYDTKIAEIKTKNNTHIQDTEDSETVSLIFKTETHEFPAKKIKELIIKKKYQVSEYNVLFENLDTKKGVLVKMLDMWYAQRKSEQKKYLQKRDDAIKIFKEAEEDANGIELTENINNRKKTKKLSKQSYDEYKECMRLSGLHYNLQWSCKILMNSLYGCLACKHFRFYDFALAASVTVSGRKVAKTNGAMINSFLEKEIFENNFKDVELNNDINTSHSIVYQDTDSAFISLNKVLNKLNIPADDNSRIEKIREISKILLKKLEDFNNEFFPKRFNGKNTVFFEQELIAKSTIFCQPKKYICYIIEEKGKAPKNPLLVKGLDIVRSSISSKFRSKIREIVSMSLQDISKQELDNYILKVYNDFKKWNLNDIAIPSSANNMEKYSCKELFFKKGSPIHIKAAISYNHFLNKYDLKEYDRIKERDRFGMLFIQNNPKFLIETFGYKDKLPKEIGIEPYINYEQHFLRGLIMPITQIFGAIQYEIPQFRNITENVDDLFE